MKWYQVKDLDSVMKKISSASKEPSPSSASSASSGFLQQLIASGGSAPNQGAAILPQSSLLQIIDLSLPVVFGLIAVICFVYWIFAKIIWSWYAVQGNYRWKY